MKTYYKECGSAPNYERVAITLQEIQRMQIKSLSLRVKRNRRRTQKKKAWTPGQSEKLLSQLYRMGIRVSWVW
ncbi:hypothetical protein XENTR_v10013909 [Xenopus tropicalis]|nr:hypothetical protein XENTR_v10013909 [Xenopus tropicalis]